MKKIITTTLLLTIVLIVLGGCSEQTISPKQKQTTQQKSLDLPTRCTIAAPIFCEDPLVNENGVSLTIYNGNDFNLENTIVKITNCGSSNPINLVPSNKRTAVNVKCALTPNEKFYGDISVEYSKGSKTGRISALVKPLNGNQQGDKKTIDDSQNEQQSIEKKTEKKTISDIKVISESQWGTWEDVDEGYKLDEIYPCDVFYTEEELAKMGKGPGLSLSINKYSANIVTQNGIVRELSEQEKSSLKRNNIVNNEILNINGENILFELVEVHSEDPETYKTLCTHDGKYCEDETDWIVLEINGYRTEIAREEVKTFEFNNGLKLNLVPVDDDVDFCLKVLK